MKRGKKSTAVSMTLLSSCILSASAFVIFAFLYGNRAVERPLTLALICGACCVTLQVIAGLLMRFIFAQNSFRAQETRTKLGSAAFDMLSGMDMPVLVCDRAGRTTWYNKAFEELEGFNALKNKKHLGDICPVPLADIARSNTGRLTEALGSVYLIHAYKTPTDNPESPLYITTWDDKSELVELRRRLHDENTLIAYIAIDNLDELYQYVQEKSGAASAQVTDIISKWASESGGVFIEYSKNRFILFFEAIRLNNFVSNKFDILDKVRSVDVGDGGLPITVSIGVSCLGTTLTEKEKAARNALDTALQRGGDQAVVRTEDGFEYYGGKTQTAQKLTKVRARVFATKLKDMIKASENVLIMGHKRPDFDAIGASLGIARLVFNCDTEANIITDPSSTDARRCMDKANEMPGYRDKEIFVTAEQALSLINEHTLLIVVDANNPAQFESTEIAAKAKKIVYIDHHRKHGDLDSQSSSVYIEPAASSTCELVAEILEYALPRGSLYREEADIMLAGIMLDSRQFVRNTGSRTFGAALFLRREGANSANAQEYFKTELADITREAAYETNVVIYNGNIAISQSGNGSDLAVDRIAAAKAADKLLNIRGIAASFVVCTMNGDVHISARSSGKINVQLILEKLGGGGHFEAAAVQISDISSEEAIIRLKVAIDNYLSENNEIK